MLRSQGSTAYLAMRSDAWRSRCSGKGKGKGRRWWWRRVVFFYFQYYSWSLLLLLLSSMMCIYIYMYITIKSIVVCHYPCYHCHYYHYNIVDIMNIRMITSQLPFRAGAAEWEAHRMWMGGPLLWRWGLSIRTCQWNRGVFCVISELYRLLDAIVDCLVCCWLNPWMTFLWFVLGVGFLEEKYDPSRKPLRAAVAREECPSVHACAGRLQIH